jgi:hypothetical protein
MYPVGIIRAVIPVDIRVTMKTDEASFRFRILILQPANLAYKSQY